MSTQRLVIEVEQGKTRSARTVDVPTDNVLIAAAVELRQLGGGKNLATGRYGECIGVYSPPRPYTITDVDPFTGARGATTPGGVISERCSFWYQTVRVVADTLYETDPPHIYYYCKQALPEAADALPPAAEPSLFDLPCEPGEEGAAREVIQTSYERNPALRIQCISIHGSRCTVCGISFEDSYGPGATGFIHVHHLEPLSAVGRAHAVDPACDLVPVCPNCHAVIHKCTPPHTPDEVRAMLRRARPD